MGGHPWTEKELLIVRTLYPTAKWPPLLKALPGRSKASIRCQVISLGIKRERNSRTPWTGAENMLLRKLYPSASWPDIVRAIPRHPQTAIARQASTLKLKRDGAKKKANASIIRELRAYRRTLNIPSDHLADRIGTHRVQLSRWERGEQLPRLQSFFDWVEALGLQLHLSRGNRQ